MRKHQKTVIGMSEWVSLSEAAELEDVEINTLVKRISRQEGASKRYITRTEPNPNGGRELVFVALESLSEAAQMKYRRREKDRVRREALLRRQEGKELPWYYEIDIGWFMEHYREEYNQKAALSAEIEKYVEQKGVYDGSLTEFCETFAREHAGICGKQFRRYMNRWSDGLGWAEVKESEDGANYEYFKILALCRPPKKGVHTKLTPEIMARIENLWACEEHHRNLQSVQMLYEDLVDQLKACNAEWIPSYTTVKRYCDELASKYSSAAVLLKKGVRGWKNSSMMKKLRNTGQLDVMELWQGDAHTFDCWIQITKPNGTVTAARPYLVAFIDTRSRCIAGWGICLQPTAEVIKKVLIHAIYPKDSSPISGVPKAILIDNGKDFTAQTLTGRKRSERFDVDGEIKGFYKSVGICSDSRALPYQPWTKAQIERCFGTICQRFSKRFASYTGTLTGSGTDAKVVKDIKTMLARGELHTLDEFAVMFEAYIEKYHMTKHKGLAEQHEPDARPIKVYENASRYQKAAPPIEYALSLLGTTVTRTVYNTGLELGGRSYMSETLARYIGERVTVRYKDDAPDCVICYAMSGEYIGEAYSYDKLNVRAEQDDVQLMEHILSQKRLLRGVRADIEALRAPAMARDDEVYPRISTEPEKVVSMPQDEQFREMVERTYKKAQRPKKPVSEPINVFMQEQAEKALERLKKTVNR